MSGMRDAERQRLRERLVVRRREIEATLRSLEADESAVLADRADGTADDEHDPEGSTLSGEWQRIEAVRRAARAERADLDAALARWETGGYGVCERCGRDIPAARLDARPGAVRCVDCASRP